ncbi:MULTISPECIES: group III truncated hemoglobin [Dyadobacter]|uniref:Group III truncated hemoglobin n=2 Tax=Dyadobacter TaxID=120831 RepID=A0A9X1T952_9BACT|nr:MULTISPECIES: group III truncated hemoglobin [Dyadobacter]MCF0040356.1 group III truncated hemoglobin [Dyadobacter fanqingshengii]MCF2494822.1 group III truncated hemoglobin [Dyadobacter chenhuakuii]MCF2519099.1 group III truncated hemoglobin [Dyadobacter sp. CY351]USJ31858.1 group III truncated hemoglobin [Dyadobacter chenhuakuii]USJ37901.1 group III truncated hemoglobin [Dyadobacter fanqingshengii]
MKTKQEILDIDDIKLLVDSFYAKVRADALLSPVFNERISDNWPQHMEKMYKFWQTVLLKEHTYYGSPFTPHAILQVDHTHFEKWMDLFVGTIDELFIGEKAQEAKFRAEKMAEMFEYKIKYYQSYPSRVIL